ncbi:MAG: hypothetical protein AAGA83_26115, partial [Cyanobacteria bacterium P01_F01_bin.116]
THQLRSKLALSRCIYSCCYPHQPMTSLINLNITRENPSDNKSCLVAIYGSVQLTVSAEDHERFTQESTDYNPWLLEQDGEITIGMSPQNWIAWLASSVIF